MVHMKDKKDPQLAPQDVQLPPVRPVVNNLPPAELQAISTDYDTMWGVSGYYLDNDGNDIRDRD